MVKECAADFKGNLRLEYSPESFTGTELEYALEVCEAVCDEWGLQRMSRSLSIFRPQWK